MTLDLQQTILIVSIIIFLLICFIGFVVILYYYKRKKTQNIFSQTLLQSQLEIQEQTLQRVSNELHDNIAQVASIIKMNLYTVKWNDINKAQQKVEDTQELVRQLITDIKALSVNLSGDRIVKIGLSKGLETEIERINKTELFTASFEKDGNLMPLDDDKAIILFRMAQEILNNMVKHSNAREIKLKLFANENLVTLAVSDDGDGFNVEDTLKNGTGAGLNNLQKRAKLINANLTISSSIGNGTNITIELPYGNPQNTTGKISTG
jgi:signal transduction histidine kinase